MKKLSVFLAFCFVATISGAQVVGYQQVLDSTLNLYSANHGFMGRVTLMKGSDVIYDRNFSPKSNNTELYRVGSVSKMFTAMMVMQLIEENKLALSTPLSQFYPQIKYSELITIDEMLSHTSGIFDVTRTKGYFANRDFAYTKKDILTFATNGKPAFKPGEDCSYSNTNYILLGYIIEDITGMTYAANLERRIVGPLSLSRTYFETGASNRSLRENSYKFDGAGWYLDKDSHPDFPAGAGAVVSCTTDLCMLMYNLFHGKIVGDSSLRVMQSLKSRSTGHGLFKSPFYEHVGWGHSGRIDEFRAFAAYFPDDSLSISITTNGMNLDLNDILIAMLASYYGKPIPVKEFKHTDIDTPPTQAFEGRYKAKLFGIFTVGRFSLVTASKNHLFMVEGTDTSGEKSLLVRTGEMTYYSGAADGELVFVKNKKGKMRYAELKQNGITIKLKRKGDLRPTQSSN